MNKPSMDDMWLFIDEVLPRYGDIVDRNTAKYDQVFRLFSIAREAHHMFKLLVQIADLKIFTEELQLLTEKTTHETVLQVPQ